MIHFSLPLRPRPDGRVELMTTALSVSKEIGSRVLCITTKNFKTERELKTAQCLDCYTRLGLQFDHVTDDSSSELYMFIQHELSRSPIIERSRDIVSCTCGKYEEIAGTRMFNLKKIVNNTCVYCNSILTAQSAVCGLLEIDWSMLNTAFTHYPKWAVSIFNSFQKRQTGVNFYKVTKRAEQPQFTIGNNTYGLRNHVLWAFQIIHAAIRLNENNITIHAVHKSSDTAYLIAGIIKTFRPDMCISFKLLPIIWLTNPDVTVEKPILISEAGNREYWLLHKGLKTSRQVIYVTSH